MDRQTVIAFILIGIIVVLWLYITTPPPQPVSEKKQVDTTLVDKKNQKDETKKEETTPPAGDTLSSGLFQNKNQQEKVIVVETEKSIIELSTRGANLRKVFLKEFNNWYDTEKPAAERKPTFVQLINYSKGGTYDISFVSSEGKKINTSDLIFSSDKATSFYLVSPKDSLSISFTFEISAGKFIKKVYSFYGDKYNINTSIELSGMNDLISNNTYDLVWSNGIRFVENNSVDEANYSNASVFYGDEQVIVDASGIGEKVANDFNGRIDWIAVRNKYFASIIIPDNPSDVEGAYIEGYRIAAPNSGVKEFYEARLIVPFKNESYEKKNFNLYIGPIEYHILQSYNRNLQKIVDFGSFFGLKFIVRPIAEFVLLPLFNFLHTFIPNYGIVIIVFSLIIKIVLYPLTKKSMQSMKKMQLLQPKINEIKEKYKEDPQKMNKETMKLYSTYGINPAGGCFPILLQMPIFIALWGLFQAAIELRNQPFFWWITDLSRPDVILDLGFSLPLFGVQQISGLALLMGITTFVQQKMSVKDPKQQALIYMMPVMLTLLFMTFPSGLNLYYFMFNVFSIAQQYYINHTHSDMVLEPVKDPSKSKGFMARLMEAAEQQAKTQQKKKGR
ncbi:MAG: membrane protein insertase YidC [Ignavibacteriaceae bacterium]|nr:membrane protein insertase YidC [Ignavibacteriaceae bacterium]